MQEKSMKSIDCNMNSVISWCSETNWVIAQGSLKDSVAVESSDNPIDESDPGNSDPKSPLILKPLLPDSGPCEIKICFEQKYEVGQVYVRSTARTYEIYYTRSPRSINEYLCTVRCGVAERDDEVLQTNSAENVAQERGAGRPSGHITAETAPDGGNIVIGEDDWINIKVPEVARSFASDEISTNGLNNIQDFYEATAQISDSDPCSSLTIRLLSLQQKGLVFVDEIYVFVGPVETTDYENEALMAGSSTQSSLMAMFMPTLLQLSKSGVNRVEDKCASDEVIKDGKMETGSMVIDKIDYHQQYVKLKELDKDTAESSELNDAAVSSELQQHTSAKKCAEPKNITNLPPGHLEITLEQVVSRLSRVEDICLRFEEKLLKPIERMEARLQQVENQLEKLVRNSHDSGLPHCTRISAPAFSCSESGTSSLYNDQSEYPPHATSDLEKNGFSCNHMPELSHEVNFHPSLVVSAPEFSCGEGEEENNDVNQLKDSPPCIKPKKTLSLDDVLAASLDGFLSTAAFNAPEHTETALGLSSQVYEENQYQGYAESHHIKAQESPAADNGNRESTRYAQVLTVKAPDFTVEEIGTEEHLNYPKSSSDTASVNENEMVPHSNSLSTSTDTSDLGKNGSSDDFGSASNGDSPAVSVKESETCVGQGQLNGSSKVSMMESYFEAVTNSGLVEIFNDSSSGPAKEHLNSDEYKSLGNSLNTDDHLGNALEHESDNASEVLEQYAAIGRWLKNLTPIVSEPSHASSLDFQFPILEVNFTCDMYSSTRSPLEALLGGAAEADTEARSTNATGDTDGQTEQIDAVITKGNGNEATDLLPINYPLVDVGVTAGDGSSILEDVSHDQCIIPSCPKMNLSLI